MSETHATSEVGGALRVDARPSADRTGARPSAARGADALVARDRPLRAPAQPTGRRVRAAAGLLATARRRAACVVSAAGIPAGMSYTTYFYPGIIVLVLLFTAIFATIAVVEDRQAGFLQGVLIAPVARSTVVLGQALGCTTLALVQGVLFLAFAPLLGIQLSVAVVLAVIAVQALMAFGLTNLGLIIAWRMDSTQGFHAIMNLILIPIWLLSGAVFPGAGASIWLEWIMRLNPLTYGVAALRHALYLHNPSAIGPVARLRCRQSR